MSQSCKMILQSTMNVLRFIYMYMYMYMYTSTTKARMVVITRK